MTRSALAFACDACGHTWFGRRPRGYGADETIIPASCPKGSGTRGSKGCGAKGQVRFIRPEELPALLNRYRKNKPEATQ